MTLHKVPPHTVSSVILTAILEIEEGDTAIPCSEKGTGLSPAQGHQAKRGQMTQASPPICTRSLKGCRTSLQGRGGGGFSLNKFKKSERTKNIPQIQRVGSMPEVRSRASQAAQRVKNPGDGGDTGSIPGSERPLEEGMATHCSTPACRTPQTEEPSELQSIGSQRVGRG